MRSSITIRLRPAGISNAEKKKRGRLHQIKRRERKEKKRMGGTKEEIKRKRMCSGISPRSTASFQLYSGACVARFLMYCCAFFSVLFSGFVNVANSVVIQVHISTSLITVWN
jgi:hypothetical protein